MMRRLRPLPLLAALALAIGAPAVAQTSNSADAAPPCTGLPNPADEIACLRALLGPAPAPPQPAAPQPEPEPEPEPEPGSALGAEQVAARQPAPVGTRPAEPTGVTALVVEARKDARGLLVMLLDNGQIWRQDESLAIPLRLDAQGRTPVEISRSGFGGYRMDFPEFDRRIVVSRLR
jgi:hypothetical protein